MPPPPPPPLLLLLLPLPLPLLLMLLYCLVLTAIFYTIASHTPLQQQRRQQAHLFSFDTM